MNEPYPPAPGYSNQPGYPPPPRQGMGCFAKGCLTVVVVVMLLIMLSGIAGWYFFRNFPSFISQKPVAIHTYQATDEQYQEVVGRYKAFVQALNAGQAATFSLSGDDLNTLIARDPEFKNVRGKMYFDVKDGEIVAETSFPIDDKNRPGQTQGYFNGRVFFTASYSGGEATMHVRKVESLDGKPMSDGLLWMFNKMDVGKVFTEVMRDERRKGTAWAEAIKRVQKVVVEKDHIVATAVEGTPSLNPVPLPDQSPEPVASPSNSE